MLVQVHGARESIGSTYASMGAMSRSSALVFVVLGAALAGFAFSSATGRFDRDTPQATPSAPARPDVANLHWRETYGAAGEQLVFEVERIQVSQEGWQVRLGVRNDTSVSYEVGDPRASLDRAFGLMLFRTGDIAELERRNRGNTLPQTRQAVRYEPELPKVLEPGASWHGTISAPGALVAGSHARVVFGTLVPVGDPENELGDRIVWITDHAHRLKP
jgi:hypothetical protein